MPPAPCEDELRASLIQGACLLSAAVCLAQLPRPAPDPNAPGVIQGIVVNRLDNTSVAQVGLRLVSEDGSLEHRYDTESDTAGNFRFAGVTPGLYRLLAERPGYLPLYAGRARPNDGPAISVPPAADVRGLIVRMMAAAVIKGRVVDQHGEAVSRGSVQVLEDAFVAGRRRIRSAGSGLTDDHGEFRIHSLPPGHYYVIAMRARTREDLQIGSVQPEKSLYVPTYYPSEVDRQMASAVDVRGGEELPLQIMLQRADTVAVRGRVLVMGKLPAHLGVVEFSQPGVSPDMLSAAARVAPDGTFETRLVPGTYRAAASVSGPAGSASGRQTVRIGREGATDLVIMIGAATRFGLVMNVLSRGNPSYPMSWPTVALLPLLDDEDLDTPTGPIRGTAERQASPTFTFENVLPGRYEVIAGGPGNIYIDSYVAEVSPQVGPLPDTIEVRGEARAKATVTLNLDGAQVSGTVYTPKGTPLPGAIVVAAPDAQHRNYASHYKTTATDQSGNFTLHGLAPGSYVVIAWDEVEDGMWLSPAFLAGAESNGVKLSLRERDRQQIPLKAIITLPQLLGSQ